MQSNYGNSNFAGKSIRGRHGVDAVVRPSYSRPTLLFLLTVAALGGFAASAFAQNPQDDLFYARTLRAHHMPDLAAEFLEHPNSPATGSWRAAFVIERARARREYALKAGNALAFMLLDAARHELQASLNDADAKPLEQFIHVELARIAAAEGHLLLERHPRTGPNWSAAELKAVRGKLREASRMLQACVVPSITDNPSQVATNEADFAERLTLERGRTALELALAHRSTDQATDAGAFIRLAIVRGSTACSRKRPTNPLAWSCWLGFTKAVTWIMMMPKPPKKP